jgi:DNA repair exonuclease SbcCD ATPase subunit
MRVFKELKTNGYVFFGKTSLDLDYKGVTVIRAKNLDARKNAPSSNGAGKSLLVGLIPEIFYDSAPTGKEVKAQSMSKAGSVTVQVKDTVYELQRTWGKKKSFEILKDGNPTKVRTLALATQKAQQIIGLSEEEFYSTAYIDVNRPHPLIRGSSARRQEYFTSMFRLHDTDALRKLLLQELRECEKAESTYKELVSQFKSIKGETSVDKIKSLESKRKALKVQVDDYVKASSALADLQEIIDFRTRYSKLMKKLEAICKPEEVEAKIAECTSERKVLKKSLEKALAYESEQQAVADAKARIKKAHEKLKLFGLTCDLEKAEKGSRLLVKTETKIQALEEVLKDLTDKLENLDKQLQKIAADSDTSVSDLLDQENVSNEKYEKNQRRQSDLRHELEHSRKFGSGKCPTCGHDVEARPVKEIKEELAKVSERITSWDSIRKIHELSKPAGDLKSRIKELKAERQILYTKKEKYTRYDSAYKSLSKLPEVPKVRTQPPEFLKESLDKELEATERTLQILEQALPVIELMKKASSLTDKSLKRHESLKQEVSQLEGASSRLAVVEATLESERQKLNDLRSMRDRALSLKEKAKDTPIIKTLLDVYSNKGLKKLMIQRYAAVIQDQLNKFRSVLFSEDFTFELNYDTQFHILCHRRYGKKLVTSDVRKLSGAEGQAFTLLLLLATLSLIPRSRRLNFLVLDEADSSMGPEMLNNFRRFIPILNKVIPHIIIVTPKTDITYEGSRVVTVVKNKGRSSLLKGTCDVA